MQKVELLIYNFNLDTKLVQNIINYLYEYFPNIKISNLFNKNYSFKLFEKYDSNILINYISSLNERNDSIYCIGLISNEIFVPGFNYVFGHADSMLNIAVVSIYRLQDQIIEKSNNKLFHRLIKEIIHELGHLLCLDHCNNKFCVMSYSENLIMLDNKIAEFCIRCKKQLNKEGVALFKQSI